MDFVFARIAPRLLPLFLHGLFQPKAKCDTKSIYTWANGGNAGETHHPFGVDFRWEQEGAQTGEIARENSDILRCFVMSGPHMRLPTTHPIDDAASLWALQQELMRAAENLLGSRDTTKNIFQPTFDDAGPRLRNTPNFDGAFVELSRNAESHWPTVVFELAHETVHLLNPTIGYTNWLEEGVAVEFSIHAQSMFDLQSYMPPGGAYLDALEMVRALPGGTFDAARVVRKVAKSLNAVTHQNLVDLFSGVDKVLLKRLAERCIPR